MIREIVAVVRRPQRRRQVRPNRDETPSRTSQASCQVLVRTTPALGTRFRSRSAYASARSRTPPGLLPTVGADLMIALRTASWACSLILSSAMTDDATFPAGRDHCVTGCFEAAKNTSARCRDRYENLGTPYFPEAGHLRVPSVREQPLISSPATGPGQSTCAAWP